MTYRALYAQMRELLEGAGVDSPAFDAACLLESATGIRRGELPLKGEREAPEDAARAALSAANRRAAGEPLQYILGEWDFLSLTLAVGEGVLIPRPDTELLCETAAEALRGMPSSALPAGRRALDLCAGSGCVGLGLASLCPGLGVTAVELSEQALPYLRQNCARYPAYAVTPVKADVLRDAARFPDGFAAIVSNPPYIPEGDLPGLMREVQREPRMALDGGGDGLLFYRCIAQEWTKKLAPGGVCAVEVGIGQADAVAALFRQAGLERVDVRRDLGEIERVVTGFRPA